jgi:hypothetical protein
MSKKYKIMKSLQRTKGVCTIVDELLSECTSSCPMFEFCESNCDPTSLYEKAVEWLQNNPKKKQKKWKYLDKGEFPLDTIPVYALVYDTLQKKYYPLICWYNWETLKWYVFYKGNMENIDWSNKENFVIEDYIVVIRWKTLSKYTIIPKDIKESTIKFVTIANE